MRPARFVSLLVVGALCVAPSAPARGASSDRRCSSYPIPGSIAASGTRTPADLVAEYGVLGQRQRTVDKLTRAELGKTLSASGVVMSGTRFLAVTPAGAAVYLVPAEHYLTFPLAPHRCLRPAQRAIEHSLRPFLQREYRHHALCLVTVYAGKSTSTCSAAPGTAQSFVYGPNNPGLGLVPNGVPRVLVHYMTHPSLDITVHRNLWVVNTIWTFDPAPCGLDWLHGAIVLRIVKSCGKIVDTT